MTALDSGRFVIAHVRVRSTGSPASRRRSRKQACSKPAALSPTSGFLPLPSRGSVLLADARAAAGWAFSAGVDATQRGQRGRRHRRQGRIFKLKVRSVRSPSSTPRRAAGDSAWLARPPAPRVRSLSPPGRTTARAAATSSGRAVRGRPLAVPPGGSDERTCGSVLACVLRACERAAGRTLEHSA